MRRTLMFLFVGVVAVATAAPAFAHEEINPANIVTGKPVFFTLSAADETKADLNKVTLTAPAGVDFGATTKEPPGWTVNRTDRVITWTGGAVKPDRFDQWGFEIDSADQPGTLSYKVTLGFADGKSDDVTVDVHASAANAGVTAPKSGSSRRANVALALAVVALVVAVAGVVLASRRRPGPGPAAATTAGAKAQDW